MSSSKPLENTHKSRWLWLAILCTGGVFWLFKGWGTGDAPHLLLGAGLLLMGPFMFYNNPLRLMRLEESISSSSLSLTGKLSLISGLCGTAAVIAAAVVRLL